MALPPASSNRRYLLLVCHDRDWRDVTRQPFDQRAGAALRRAREVLDRKGQPFGIDENDVPPGTLWENADASARPYASPRYLYAYANQDADFDGLINELDVQGEKVLVTFEQLGTGTWSMVDEVWTHRSWPMQ